MTEQLYALQRDLDMVTDDVNNLKKSYELLDYIAKIVQESHLEQLAQAAQMRRIEEELVAIRTIFGSMEKRLEAVEGRIAVLEKRMDAIERRMDYSEKTLGLIVKHLGIKTG